MIKRHEIERDTLLALQEALIEHYGLTIRFKRHRLRAHLGQDVDEAKAAEAAREYHAAGRTLEKLAARALDRNPAEAVLAYMRAAARALAAPSNGEIGIHADAAHHRAQELLGEAIRRPPELTS
ncbi:hypothetical protein [Spirillospora sp. CA-128828]|uniref:hypothetical protein n=1 Tax=Spirillospora sp. CA-128828 TaxID=3240033 RepID=UPI003D8CB887